jgi:hypothetical protein
LLLLLIGCGSPPGPVAVVRVDAGLELDELRRQVAQRYYAERADDRDMLVLWDSSSSLFSHVSYLSVANDVLGIGQADFDDAGEFGSARLQGMVTLGRRWRQIPDGGQPDSALGALIAESLHRWGAMVRHDPDSDALLSSDGQHWSGLVDAGDSPLGGNRWTDLGGGMFSRAAGDADSASDLDLYLMGLLAADQVAPIRLLVDVSAGLCSQPMPCADGWRDGPPEQVTATAVDVGADQVIAAEGERVPATGPAELRQGWVYVVHGDDEVDAADVDRLEGLRDDWQAFYAQVTRGLGSVVTE